MPVYKSAVGIVFPGPHVKRVKRWQPETVGAFKIVKELSHQLWRALSWMILVPLARDQEKVSTDQLQMAVWHRLVNNNLRVLGVD